jgi:hypothetical protein
MSNPWFNPVLNFFVLSILIPFLTGIFRWKHIDPRFHVFIIYLGLGSAMEVLNMVLYHTNHYTRTTHHLSFIIYTSLEAILLVQWLLRLDFIDKIRIKKVLYCLVLAAMVTIIVDYLLLGYDTYRLHLMSFLFQGILIFFTIQLLVNIPRHADLYPFRRSLNLILIPLLISEVVYVFILLFSFITPLLPKLFGIVSYTRYVFITLNFIGYLSYTMAFLWAPNRIKFLSTSH